MKASMIRMLRCRECGRWFFNKGKLTKHLIEEHGYVIELKEEQDGRRTAMGSD